MTGTVFDKLNEAPGFVQYIQNPLCHSLVGLFFSCTSIMNLRGDSPLQDLEQGPNMVLNVDPVTDVLTVTVQRQRLIVQGISNE